MGFDLSGFEYEPHCEPLKRLGYVIDTGEVISEYESKYRQGEKQFNNYKQFNDKTSLEWFCSDELIKLYESWDCKNLEKYKPSKGEIDRAKSELKIIKNLPTNALLKVTKEAIDLQKNSPYDKLRLIEEARKGTPEYMDSIKRAMANTPEAKLARTMANTPMEIHKRAMENTPEGIMKKQREEAKQLRKLVDPLSELRAVQAIHNSPITPAYISTAETALKALDGRSALIGKVAGIDPTIHKLASERWKERIGLNNALIAQLDSLAFKSRLSEAQRINDLITPAYIETAKTALSAFNSDLHRKDVLSRIHGYTTATEQILNIGINAGIAKDMLPTHWALLESYRYWERPKKPTKKELKKENKKLKSDKKKLKKLNTQQHEEDNKKIAILEDQIKIMEKELSEKDVELRLFSALLSLKRC